MKIRIVQFGPMVYKEAWDEFDAIPFGDVFADFSYYFWEEFLPIYRQAVEYAEDFERWPYWGKFQVLLESGVLHIAEDVGISPTQLRRWAKEGIPRTYEHEEKIREYLKKLPKFDSYYAMGLLLYYEHAGRRETKRVSSDVYLTPSQAQDDSICERLYQSLWNQLERFATTRWEAMKNRYEDEEEDVYLGVVGVVAKSEAYSSKKVAGRAMFDIEVSEKEKSEIARIGYGVGTAGEIRRALSDTHVQEVRLEQARERKAISGFTFFVEKVFIKIKRFFLRVIKDLFGG